MNQELVGKLLLIFALVSLPAVFIYQVIQANQKQQTLASEVRDNNTPTQIIFEDIASVVFPCKATKLPTYLNKDEFPNDAQCFVESTEQGNTLKDSYTARPRRFLTPSHTAADFYNYCVDQIYTDPNDGSVTKFINTHVESFNNINFKVCGLVDDKGTLYEVVANAVMKNKGISLNVLNSSYEDSSLLWTKLDNFIKTVTFIN